MSSEEWYSLKVGSIVGNKVGKNPRAVIEIGDNLHAITLPSDRDRKKRGYVVYLHGDKHGFKLLKN